MLYHMVFCYTEIDVSSESLQDSIAVVMSLSDFAWVDKHNFVGQVNCS